jgi:hypothetical protein
VHLLKNIDHFLGSKENLPAIIGVLGAVTGSLFGALIGGYMTSRSALRAQKQVAKDQRQRDQEAERRAINSILQAIAAELRVLKGEFFDKLQSQLNDRHEAQEGRQERSFRQSQQPLSMTRTTQKYFIVFESNAGAIGRIEDEVLREDIIRVYGHAKGLVDDLNAYFRDSETWREISGTSPDRQTLPNRLQGLETEIRNDYALFTARVDELLTRIEEYLKSGSKVAS